MSYVPTQNLRKPYRCIDAQVLSSAGLSQITIDKQSAHALSLGQKPRKIESGEGFTFTDSCAGDHKGTHLFAFACLQQFCAQRTKLFTIWRARLTNSDKVRFDARRRNVITGISPHARRPGSAQS